MRDIKRASASTANLTQTHHERGLNLWCIHAEQNSPCAVSFFAHAILQVAACDRYISRGQTPPTTSSSSIRTKFLDNAELQVWEGGDHESGGLHDINGEGGGRGGRGGVMSVLAWQEGCSSTCVRKRWKGCAAWHGVAWRGVVWHRKEECGTHVACV